MKRKDIKFSTRMAAKDREAIKELAKQSGMSMSKYVTDCCLGKQTSRTGCTTRDENEQMWQTVLTRYKAGFSMPPRAR